MSGRDEQRLSHAAPPRQVHQLNDTHYASDNFTATGCWRTKAIPGMGITRPFPVSEAKRRETQYVGRGRYVNRARKMPNSYNTSRGNITSVMLKGSGVGVMMAATIAMITMA